MRLRTIRPNHDGCSDLVSNPLAFEDHSFCPACIHEQFLEGGSPEDLRSCLLGHVDQQSLQLSSVRRQEIVLRVIQQAVIRFKQNFPLPALHFENLGRGTDLSGSAKRSKLFQNRQAIRLESQTTRNALRTPLSFKEDCRDPFFLKFYCQCQSGYTRFHNYNVSLPGQVFFLRRPQANLVDILKSMPRSILRRIS